LAGGGTPKKLYQLIASDAFRDQYPWQNIHVYFGDERCVPAKHGDSNFRMANGEWPMKLCLGKYLFQRKIYTLSILMWMMLLPAPTATTMNC
jgi:hypothetical protein